MLLNAAPDGYTLMLVSVGHAVNASLSYAASWAAPRMKRFAGSNASRRCRTAEESAFSMGERKMMERSEPR